MMIIKKVLRFFFSPRRHTAKEVLTSSSGGQPQADEADELAALQHVELLLDGGAEVV